MVVSYKNQELLTLAVFFVVFVFSLCLVYPMLPVSTDLIGVNRTENKVTKGVVIIS
jgi:hypothetical protein